jgi:hypothetical protein
MQTFRKIPAGNKKYSFKQTTYLAYKNYIASDLFYSICVFMHYQMIGQQALFFRGDAGVSILIH